MDTKQMIELAAVAAGIKASWGIATDYGPDGEEQIELTDLFFIEGDEHCAVWNPKDDDGDSRRLQVALRIDLDFRDNSPVPEVRAIGPLPTGARYQYLSRLGPDPAAAARMAVLYVAAQMGAAMKEQGK